MAAKSKIVFDRTEIVLMDTSGKRAQVFNLPYDRIISIQFDKTMAKKLFSSVETEKISITVRGREMPIEFFGHLEGAFFEEYKKGLEKFAKDNNISFRNNLAAK